ncbi:amidohydrolase family protein [Saprospiraceae bacterium]|nr:amidohydrolase family protein [Saprospiraceae bacterium]
MYKTNFLRSLLLIFFVSICSLTFAQKTYIHCGTLIDATNKKSKKEMTIIVENKKILDVQKGYTKPPAGVEMVDLKDYTIMPGFMDMHVHIEHESNPKRYEESFRMNEADIALKATLYCERTLMAGFTTIRDLGGTGVNVSLQSAIDRGYVTGPKIYTAEKSIATTGGHADPTNGVRKDLKGDPGPKEGVINSPEEAAKAVRQRYKNGADCIKITATGGVLSVAKDGSGPQFTMEELKAIVATANDYGMITAAHAHGKEGIKRAVLAGITSIEHGTLMDQEVMDLMIEKGTYYVPTISAGKFVAEKAKIDGFYPAVIVPKALAIGPQIQRTFGKAYKAGVKIAFGTDAGVSPHGDNGKEFGFMVEAGMSEIDAIISATRTPAEMLKIDDERGTIKPGLIADIIAVKGDPLENILLLENVQFVMKEGTIYKNK